MGMYYKLHNGTGLKAGVQEQKILTIIILIRCNFVTVLVTIPEQLHR